MDAEHRRSAALVAVAMLQHFGEQRNLEFAQRDLVQIGCVGTVQIADVTTYGIRDMIAQRRARNRAGGGFVAFGVQARSLRWRVFASAPSLAAFRRRNDEGGESLACAVADCHDESQEVASPRVRFPMNGDVSRVSWPDASRFRVVAAMRRVPVQRKLKS